MILIRIMGVERELLLAQSADGRNDPILVPRNACPYLCWIKSGDAQCFVEIAKNPAGLIVNVTVFGLEIFGRDVTVRSVYFSDGSNPVALPVWIKSRPRAPEHPKIRGDELVGPEMVFVHVFLAVDTVLGEMPTAYDTMMVTTDPAADKIHPLNAVQSADTRF